MLNLHSLTSFTLILSGGGFYFLSYLAQHDYTVISRLCVSHYFTFVASMLHYFVRKSVYLRVGNWVAPVSYRKDI